ncbi:uncharacterized protein C19orf84 homolog [Dipodomys merriami]|uniref:uncharacterized protein C19orf84 homolog n=1 Tax=Dipodomys merriami TaxID=94247 RepID=UPI0038559D8A
MEQQKDKAESEGNNQSLPTPGTQLQTPGTIPALPPWLLGTSNPAQMGLPEHLASVTVPIRLDTLSYLLHSALMGTYSLYQSLPSCPCASQPGHGQPATASCSPTPRGRGRGRGWARGGRGFQHRPAPSQGQPRWGAEDAEQPKRSGSWDDRAVPKVPRLAAPAQDDKESRDPEPDTNPWPAAEDWESES